MSEYKKKFRAFLIALEMQEVDEVLEYPIEVIKVLGKGFTRQVKAFIGGDRTKPLTQVKRDLCPKCSKNGSCNKQENSSLLIYCAAYDEISNF